MNPGWAEAVPAMIRDVALMPAGTWAKYWRGAMLFLDWLVDPDCQACYLAHAKALHKMLKLFLVQFCLWYDYDADYRTGLLC